MATQPDIRQIIYRGTASRLTGAANSTGDTLVAAINQEVTPPLALSVTGVDRTVTVGSITVTNPDTSLNRTIPPISNVLPTFTSGTLTLGTTGAGTIVANGGGNTLNLGMSASQFERIGINITASGVLTLTQGTPASTLAAATTPPTITGLFAIGEVVVRTDGSNNTQTAILTSDLYQYVGGGSGGGSQTAVQTPANSTILTTTGTTTVTSNQLTAVPVSETPTGNTTNGSVTVTSLSSTTGVFVGSNITGTGIPAGTTVQAISGSSITLSNAATATNTGTTLTIVYPLTAGMLIAGTGIQAGTTILSVSGTTVTMSLNATASASGVALTFSHNYESGPNVQTQLDYIDAQLATIAANTAIKNYIKWGASTATGWQASGAGITVATDTTAADLPYANTTATGIKFTGVSGGSVGGLTPYGYYRFTLDAANYNMKQQIQFAMNALSGYVSNDFQVSIYSNTNSTYTGTSTRLPLSTDTASVSGLPNLEGIYRTTFDSPGSTAPYMELRIGLNSSNTHSLVLSDVIVGPGTVIQGAAVTGWSEFTPTWTNITVGNGSTDGLWRRVGDSIEVTATITFGSTTSVTGNISPVAPLGLTFVTAISQNESCGDVVASHGGTFLVGNTQNLASAGGVYFVFNGASTATPANATNPFTWTNTDTLRAHYTIPIAQWAGSGTLNVVQNDVEYAYNNGASTSSNDTTSFAYGSGGTPILSFSAPVERLVQFQTPITATSQIVLEVQNGSSAPWIQLTGQDQQSGLVPYTLQATTSYGIGFALNTTASAGQVAVRFGNYAYPNGSTYAAAGAAWSGFTGFNWRLKKFNGGQAVGFSTVQPGVSAGLVSASGVPGNTTGNAITAGYIGEIIAFTQRTVSAITSGYSANSTALTTLSPGLWAVYGYAVCTPTTSLTAFQAFVGTNSNNDSSGTLPGTQGNAACILANSTSTLTLPLVVGYVNTSTSQALYAKAETTGAASSVAVGGFAVRIA